MENKIVSYVRYIFNINKIEDEEMFDEVTSNLIDRYHSFTEQNIDSETAYSRTINTLGDFNFDKPKIKETFNYNPNWANISLWVSLGLAVLGTIILLLNNTMSILFTGVSISLYIASAYYLYHLSQYTLKVEKDVLKHNELLKGIFKNLKTSFIFWNINISFWLTSILGNVIFAVLAYNTGSNPVQLSTLVLTYLAIFAVVFGLIFVIFKNVYSNIENKYYELTQNEKLESYIGDKNIINLDDKIIKIILKVSKSLLVALYAAIILLGSIHVEYRSGFARLDTYISLNNNPFNSNLIDVILSSLILIVGIVTIIAIFTNKKKLKKIGSISFLILHIATIIYLSNEFLSSRTIYANKKILGIGGLHIISLALVLAIIVISHRLNAKNKNKEI